MRQWIVFPFLPIPWQKVLQKNRCPSYQSSVSGLLVNCHRWRKVGYPNKWLQGLSHEMDLAFGLMTCMVSPRPKYGARPVFKLFTSTNDFITQKVYFPRLMRVCVGLTMLVACTYSRFSCFLASQQGFGHFLSIALASHWPKDLANCTPTPEENDKYSANLS
jgi:hypothetical protein